MVPRLARAQCSKVRLERGRESPRWSTHGRYPHSATFKLRGPRAPRNQASLELSILKVVPTSEGLHEGQLPRASTDQHKIINQVGLPVVPK